MKEPLRIVVGGVEVTIEAGSIKTLRRPFTLRYPDYIENWNVSHAEVIAYIERLESVLGREITDTEAERLLHPIFNTIHVAEKTREVLAGGAVIVPVNDGGGDVYLEVHELPDHAEHAKILYERSWSEVSEAERKKWGPH